jgi:hypothetical protein
VFGVSSKVCGVESGWSYSPKGVIARWKTAEASMDVGPRLTHQEKETGEDRGDSVAQIIDKSSP